MLSINIDDFISPRDVSQHEYQLVQINDLSGHKTITNDEDRHRSAFSYVDVFCRKKTFVGGQINKYLDLLN